MNLSLRLTIEPLPSAVFPGADPPAVIPRSVQRRMPEPAVVNGGFGVISFDALTDELVDVVTLRHGQSSAFALAMSSSVIERLSVFHQPEARVARTRFVIGRTQTTLF